MLLPVLHADYFLRALLSVLPATALMEPASEMPVLFGTCASHSDQNQRQNKRQTVSHRAGPEHPGDPNGPGKQDCHRHQKYNLTRQGHHSGFHRFANGLQINCRNGLESVERTEHQENAETFDRKLVVKPFFRSKQRHHTHRRKLEQEECQHSHHLCRGNGNLKSFFNPGKIFTPKIVANYRLRTDRNAHQNRQHNLIDLHHNAHGRQRNFRAINRCRAIVCQQIVKQRHDHSNGNLGDKTAHAQTQNLPADFCIQPQCSSVPCEKS